MESPTAAPPRRRLTDMTPDEHVALGVEGYHRQRRQEYREALAQREYGAELTEWATALAETYGPLAKAHHNAVTWPIAFMVGRYGEETAHWPDALSAEDRERMTHWLKSPTEFSAGIRPLGPSPKQTIGEHLFGLDDVEHSTLAAPTTPEG